MRAAAFLLFVIAAAAVLAVPTDRHVVAHRSGAPIGFRITGPTPKDHVMSFSIHLTLAENEETLKRLFDEEVASPETRRATPMTYDEVAHRFRAADGAEKRVAAWLISHGVVRLERRMATLRVTATVASIEEMFNVHIAEHHSVVDLAEGVHTAQHRIVGEMSVPASLRDDVRLVVGLSELRHLSENNRPSRRFHASAEVPVATSGNYNGRYTKITPSVLREIYQVSGSPSSPSTRQCIGSFGSYYSAPCLKDFVQQVDGASYGVIEKSIGYNCFGEADQATCEQAQDEADLDVQYITSMSSGVATWVWQAAANATDAQEWMLNWGEQVNAQTGPISATPQVYSLSYGLPELWQCISLFRLSHCAQFGYDVALYVAAADMEFMKMGHRGWTVMVATGDDGAAGDSSNLPYATGYRQGGVNQLLMTASIQNETISCAVPLGGMGRGILCSIVGELCPNVLNLFVQGNYAQKAGCSLQLNSVLSPQCSDAQPSVTTNCTFAQFPTQSFPGASGVQCAVGPYQYATASNWGGADVALLPNYPAISPYITAVGASMLTCPGAPSCSAPSTEVTCSSATGAAITSAGYFSPLHAMPAWQKAAVETYLHLASAQLPPSYVVNYTGRAVPDVSLLGHNYLIEMSQNGQCVQTPGIDGTSASSPSFAGMISLINDARFQSGKSSIGFLNGLLYSAPAGTFTDITIGSNRCRQMTTAMSYDKNCHPTQVPWVGCSIWGFPATTGYDAATGLGSPIFPSLKSFLLAQP